jgi:hypothetical protein
MDARFSAVSKEYSNFPVFSKSKWFRLAVGMSTDDFLHEYGLDVLVASDPEKYPYDKDFCIDLPEEEIRVASKNGTIVYVSVYNYRLQGNGWEMYSPEGPAMFTMGFEGGGIFRHIMIDDVKAKLESKYGTPEYLTVDKSALRKREPENWAVYQIKADGYKDGYMVFKYRDNGRVPEIGTGIISAEEIAALPQYTQMLTREFISPGLWYIPFDW